MKAALLAAAAVFLTGSALAGVKSKPAGATNQLRAVSPEELMTLRASGAAIDLVDVRSPEDFRKQHLVGARNAPFFQIGRSDIPCRDCRVVVYCSNFQCGLASESARVLMTRGVAQVGVLSGGLQAALAAGMASEGETRQVFKPRNLTTEALSTKLALANPPLIIDTRPRTAFLSAHLPGAVNVPLESFAPPSAPSVKGKEIVICDSSPQRAALAADRLAREGYSPSMLEGGVLLWSQEGRTLSSGPR